MLSMTGYGTGSAELGTGRLVIEARGVNHRFLEIQVRLPAEVADYASVSDTTARKLLERGRIEITGRIEESPGGIPELRTDRAKAAYAALTALRDELCPGEPVPLSLLAAVPELFAMRDKPSAEQLRRAVQTATEEACLKLYEMRTSEGALLAVDLRQRVEFLRGIAERIRGYCPKVVDGYRRKLRTRIEKLTAESDISLNPGRLEQEIALFADRSDVSEEITRLASHCDQFESMLTSAPDPAGRRMEFLLQEMVREANTIGSKVAELEVTRLVLELKAELERMREQVQNVL